MTPFYLLYIDPGTGSMLFSLAIGIATAAVFGFRALMVKVRFVLSGGKADKTARNKIPYVVFSDHKRYWNVFKPICDEFEKRQIPLVYLTQSEDDPCFSADYTYVKPEFIGEGNKGFVRMNMLNAGVVLSTTPGLDVLQWKRSKLVDEYVHVPHSMGDLSSYRMFGLDFYDTILASGQNQVDFAEKIESVRDINKRKKIIAGSTLLDAAMDDVSAFEKHTTDASKPVILIAPSWGVSSILCRFGDELLESLTKTGFSVIVRPHPQSYTADKAVLDALQSKYQDVEWNRENSNLAVMNRADLMITDFSDIMFEWTLLFNRPFMYAETHFDTSVYDADWFDEDMWTIAAARKIGIPLTREQFPDIRNVILNALASQELAAARDEIALSCWGNRGKAAEAIVDYVLGERHV